MQLHIHSSKYFKIKHLHSLYNTKDSTYIHKNKVGATYREGDDSQALGSSRPISSKSDVLVTPMDVCKPRPNSIDESLNIMEESS